MKNRILLVVLAGLIAATAYAGTQRKTNAGAAPSAATDGVSILDAVACRMSIFVDGGALYDGGLTPGHIAAGCKLVPHYYDPNIGSWVESASSLHCTTAARLDGGTRDSYVCADTPVAARFGRMAVQKVYCTGSDGGTGAALQEDGGAGPDPKVQLECWGPKVIKSP